MTSNGWLGLALVVAGVAVWVAAPLPFSFVGFVWIALGIGPALEGAHG